MNADGKLLDGPYSYEGKVDNVVSFNNEFAVDEPEQAYDTLGYESKVMKVKELAAIYNVDEKKILRKIDLCVVPPFLLLYFLAYFNRSSFGFIYSGGIQGDLHISNLELYSSYTAFFAPYILFQFFANFLMDKVRPHFWISFSVFVFGAVTLGSGFVHNFGVYTFLHFLHGVVQAGSETAIFYILAHYYTSKEAQRRFSAIYSVSCIAGIASNLIAYGVESHLTGDKGWLTWRWALIVYGSLTTFSSFILFFIIPDFPEGARFFNDDETLFIIKKLEIFGGKSGYGLASTPSEIIKCGIDPLIWLPALSSLGISYATYVYAFHEPQIIGSVHLVAHNISYGSYPWVVAFVWCNVSGYVSELLDRKYYVVVGNMLIAIVGSLLLVCGKTDSARYAGCFLVAAGGYSALPIILCWATLNVGGHLRKSMVTSLQISFGSIGGLIALFSFYKQESTGKVPFIVCVVLQFMTLFTCLGYYIHCNKLNTLKRTSHYKERFFEKSEKQRMVFSDKNPNFDYKL